MAQAQFEGKTVIVTGAASGIGKATVIRFLMDRASVLAIDRDQKALNELGTECSGYIHEGMSLLRFVQDVSDAEGLKKLFSSQQFTFRPASVLINNAGVCPEFRLEGSQEDRDLIWAQTLAVNLTGARVATEVFLRQARRQDSPSIIFVTSVHTALGFRNQAAYDASKHGLLGYMRSLAADYAIHGCRVNAVAPGYIFPTNISPGNSDPQAQEAGSKKIPMGKTGYPSDISSVIAFLASNEAEYIHGAEIRVDGGLSIANTLDY